MTKWELKKNEIHSFHKSFLHSINVINAIKVTTAGKDKLRYGCINILKRLMDTFKVAADSGTVEDG